jgi:agmatinase
MLTATLLSATIFALASTASGHSSHGADDQAPLTEDRITRWKSGYTFTGIQTFAHLPHVECLVDQEASFDIAVIGAPFDTSVAYRPGARFGPRAIRSASQRQVPSRGFNPVQGINPYQNWATFLDCGDIPITPL